MNKKVIFSFECWIWKKQRHLLQRPKSPLGSWKKQEHWNSCRSHKKRWWQLHRPYINFLIRLGPVSRCLVNGVSVLSPEQILTRSCYFFYLKLYLKERIKYRKVSVFRFWNHFRSLSIKKSYKFHYT